MACDCEKCKMLGTFKKQTQLIKALESRIEELEQVK